MSSVKIRSLKYALELAKAEALKLQNVEDGGTCNFDTPMIVLTSDWKDSDVHKVFRATGLRPYKVEKNVYHVLGAVEGQGFRRTAMAEAFKDCLRNLGYSSYVYYQMD